LADFNRIVVKAFADYLRTAMPTCQVLEEWPTANQQLTYPSISISTERCPLIPASSMRETAGAVNSQTHIAPVRYEVGQYEFVLQVDLWERTKPQRSELVDSFIRAFNKDIIPAGLRLQLTGYYDQWVSMWLMSQAFEDSGRGSQVQEWRARMDVEGACVAIRETTDHIIETPVLVPTFSEMVKV
jgi:hypothetical protein